MFDKRLQSFIDHNCLLSDSQYGFRSGCSTSHALLELIEEISSSLDKKKVTIGVFIDLKKAFDTIVHSLLIRKLQHYGIRGVANDWIKSYLHCRQQFVQVDEHRSSLLHILCGVPQGSVLGPKLFILYINDICNVSKLVNFILFADDTNVFQNGDDLSLLCKQLTIELDKLNIWFDVNKLSLNVQKTNFIIFGKRNYSNAELTIQNKQIEQVHVTKFLGVLIDDRLCWNYQIANVKNKLAKCAAVLFKARCLVDNNVMLLLYNSLFLPYISYCAEVWANTYRSKLNVLTKLQMRVIRLIANVSKLSHTNELFAKFKLLKFVDLVEYKTDMLMYNAYHHKLPVRLQKLFLINDLNENTRQKQRFKVNYRRTNIKAFCISSTGTKLWNSLPKCITESKSIHIFKYKLKCMLLSRY